MAKRFTVTENRDGMGFSNGLSQCDDGDLASWDDYLKVVAERDALAEDMTAAQGQIADAQSIIERDSNQRWQDMETAPRNGTEINGYRPDQGVFTFRWAHAQEFVDHNIEGDPIEKYPEFEWWWHDRWGWMEKELTPTKWMPLPAPPTGDA